MFGLKNNKKIIAGIFLALVAIIFVSTQFVDIKTAEAQVPPITPSTIAGSVSLFKGAVGSAVEVTSDVFNWLLARLAELSLYITGFFLGLVSMLLNEVVVQTIVNMSANLKDALVEGGRVNLAWTAFRDLANLFFIFVILYIAIMTILRTDTATTKKLLVHVVIIALLLNFSLFFTKLIIDASNVPAIYFYEQVSQSGGEFGLAGAFMQKLGITSVFDPTGFFGSVNADQPSLKIFVLGVFGSILFMVSGVVFLSAALMLIIRFFILVFLMIFSPLAFVAMALPDDKWSKKWWDTLFSQIIFAPAFFALIFVALTVLEAVTSNLGIGASFGDLVAETGGAPQTSTTQLLLNFLMVIGVLIFSLFAAREIGVQGSAGAIKFARRTAGAYLSPIRQLGAPTARSAIRTLGLRKAYEKATQTRAFQGGKLPWYLGGGVAGGMLHSGMERTLGATVKGKIGTKSALEAYEEDEELTSRRRAIRDLTAARRAEKMMKKSKSPEVRAELQEKKREIEKLARNIKEKLYTDEMRRVEEERNERRREVTSLQEEFAALMKVIEEKEGQKQSESSQSTGSRERSSIVSGDSMSIEDAKKEGEERKRSGR